jgi:TRAP-type C4-dicarboxylate transport system substrate-binding protein
MQRKVIDCMLLPWDLIATNRLYEIAKFGSNITFGTIVSHIDAYNLAKWNSLTPEVRKLLDDAAVDARKRDLEIITKSNDEAVELMKKNGVTFENFPDQKKMEAMLPNFIDVWADKQKQAGRGDAAAAIAKRWKELAAQFSPKS